MGRHRQSIGRFLVRLIAWGALLTDPLAVARAQPVIVHGPYLSDIAATEAMINWSTSSEAQSAVELQGDGGWRTIAASRDGLIVTGTRHAVRVTGLAPGQRYTYRIIAKPILAFGSNHVNFGSPTVSEPFDFETLSPEREEFTVIIFNDLHGDLDRLGRLFRQVHPVPGDLVFFNGDMVDHLVDDETLNKLIDFCTATFSSRIPLLYLRGNHETRGREARTFSQRFPRLSGELFSSLHQGPASFILLDSGEDKEDNHPEYSGLVDFDAYRSRIQTPWLRGELARTPPAQAVYKIALVHMPLFGGLRWHGERQISQLWMPLFNQAGVDLEISGHTHVRMWLPADHILRKFPIMIGGTHSFLRLKVTRALLTLEAVDENGKNLEYHEVRPRT